MDTPVASQLQRGGSGMGTPLPDSASLGPFWVLRREGVFQTTQDTVCAAWRVWSSGSPLHWQGLAQAPPGVGG